MPVRRGLPEPALRIAAGLAAAIGLACSAPRIPEGAPERIVLISLDTLRADRLTPELMPTVLEIAAEGVRFRNAWSASSYTIPSHMSLFTGLDPAEHGVSTLQARLDPEVPTLASLLRGAGYRTRAFHEGVFVDARFGFDQGFEKYEQVRYSLVSDLALNDVFAWMERMLYEPYFLFLHTYAVHFPYGGYDDYRERVPERNLPTREDLLERRKSVQAGGEDPTLHYHCTLYNQLAQQRNSMLDCGDNRPDSRFTDQPHFEADREAIERSYDERVRHVDHLVKLVRDQLRATGQWEDTLLVVTSDHGDAFYEHGLYRHSFVPFDEALRVPLVISWPRALADLEQRELDGVVSHLDLLPTLLGLVGVPAPEPRQGRNLAPVIAGEDRIEDDRTVFPGVLRAAQLEQVPLRRVLVGGDRKWIQGHSLFGDAEGYLFDLARDPGERDNLRTERPDEWAALQREARAYDEGLAPARPVDQKTGRPLAEAAEQPAFEGLEPEALERLRALGYGD